MAHYSHVIYAFYQNMPQNVFASCSFATKTLLRGYIHPNEKKRSIYTINALSFRCTLMILDLSLMRRNVNRNVYNAWKM